MAADQAHGRIEFVLFSDDTVVTGAFWPHRRLYPPIQYPTQFIQTSLHVITAAGSGLFPFKMLCFWL